MADSAEAAGDMVQVDHEPTPRPSSREKNRWFQNRGKS